jgi:hypothetical protein
VVEHRAHVAQVHPDCRCRKRPLALALEPDHVVAVLEQRARRDVAERQAAHEGQQHTLAPFWVTSLDDFRNWLIRSA